MMNYKSLSMLALVVLALSGCDSRVADVTQQMTTIRNQPPLPIEPPPTFNLVPLFNYDAQNLRSPFLPKSLYTELKVMAGKRVYPDFSRQPQPLESYALETLNMKGSMKDLSGRIVALIQTPDGDIDRVQVGNYIGLNQGRITKITPTSIELTEIISDGHDGYVERPRSLVLIGPTS